jgi:hypothetical protein
VWRDRAVFHFRTDEPAIRAYANVASVAVRAGGAHVVDAFPEDGPTKCSGLATARYTPEALAGQFAAAFEVGAFASRIAILVILLRKSSRRRDSC